LLVSLWFRAPDQRQQAAKDQTTTEPEV